MSAISVAVALIRNDQGDVLVVRKRGTSAFMQPGGKIEHGEDPRSALVRELAEELSCTVSDQAMHYLGRTVAPAVNEPGMFVDARIFAVSVVDEFVAGGEIAELAWVAPDRTTPLALAPLTRDHVLKMAGHLHDR